jgi:putative addiction module CopG family antidote
MEPKMNISLTPKLKEFVEQKVRDGLYEDPSDVVRHALRTLQERERLLPITRFPETQDIDALVILVLMNATKDMDEDLKMIMAEVKAMTAAKAKLRELITRVNRDVANNAGQRESKRPLTFTSGGMGSERAYHNAQTPFPDPNAESGVKLVQSDLHRAKIDSVEILESIRDELKGKLDGMNEISEMTSLRLQMIMDRRSKFMSTLSNIMKKISRTQDTLAENLK